MSIWSPKALGRDQEYIVLKHNLRGVNAVVDGVKFRHGYAVVAKDSKTYYRLKNFPNLRNSSEYPLTFLRQLPFITRTKDVLTVYGKDVYVHFLKAEQNLKEEELRQQVEQKEKEQLDIENKREDELKKKKELEDEMKKIEKKIEESANEGLMSFSEDTKEKLEEIKQKHQELTKKCVFRTTTGKLCKNDAISESPSGYCKMHLLEDPKLPEFGIMKPKFMTKEDRKSFKEEVIKILSAAKK